jgi:hypothetical protein
MSDRDDKPVERRPYSQDPTAVDHTRTSESSTVSNGGLGGGRPEGGATVTPERARYEESSGHGPDVVGGHDVPHSERAIRDESDPVMPADDATLNTKI